MRIRKQKKERQHNGQKEKDKTDLQNNAQTTKDETLFLLIISDGAEEE